MTLWLKLLAFTVGATALVAVFLYITDAEDAKNDLRAAEDHIETRERIDNATSADRDCPWHDRLFDACE